MKGTALRRCSTWALARAAGPAADAIKRGNSSPRADEEQPCDCRLSLAGTAITLALAGYTCRLGSNPFERSGACDTAATGFARQAADQRIWRDRLADRHRGLWLHDVDRSDLSPLRESLQGRMAASTERAVRPSVPPEMEPAGVLSYGAGNELPWRRNIGLRPELRPRLASAQYGSVQIRVRDRVRPT